MRLTENEAIQLTENEAIQLLQCMLGGVGYKKLGAIMGLDPQTISAALSGSDRLYRDETRKATKKFFNNCLHGSRTNVSAYIASAYEWLTEREPGYSNKILEAIAKLNLITADGDNIDWSSTESVEDLEYKLNLLPNLNSVAAAFKECIQIETWLEHRVRANRGKRSSRQKQEEQIGDLCQYDKEIRALETAKAEQRAILPAEHVKRDWLIERVLHADGSVTVIEAPAGYGKTTLLDNIVSDKSFAATSLHCKWDDPARNEQMSILDALNDQLASVSKVYRDAIEQMSKASESPSDKINSMISAMQKVGSESQPVRRIIIDALDELKDSTHVLNVLDRLAIAGGYGWLKVICSTRKWEAGREDRGYCVIRPLEEPEYSVGDIEVYALKRLQNVPHSIAVNVADIASTIAGRSSGIFQYAVIVLDALCNGIVGMDDIHELPSDIFSLYDWYLARYLDGTSAADKDNLITILNMVAASAAPVPEEIITCALSLGSRSWSKTKSSLDRFLVCTRTSSGTLYSLFHKSFADYLFSSRHGGESAEEEGVAFLAMGCYRAKGLDRLSYWASDYIQVYLVWLLYRASNNALLDVRDFDLGSARLEVLHDEGYAKSCLDLFEPAQDVIAFQTPAREEVLSWSAMRIFGEILSSEERIAGCGQQSDKKERLCNWLFSCNHHIFVLVSMSRFNEALRIGNQTIAALSDLDAQECDCGDELEKEILQEYALLYETIAYDVLTVGQPSINDDEEVSVYYERAIRVYSFLNDIEGYLKAACNKALYEVEHVDAKQALQDIEKLISACGLQNSLLSTTDQDKRIMISNPCIEGTKALIKAESAFNHMNNLGYCLTLSGKETEGLRLFAICEALTLDEVGAGRDGLFSEHDKAELYHLESIAYYRLGEYAMAVNCEEKAIPSLQEVWGADSPKLCGPYNMIGSAYHAMHQPYSAISFFERALSIAGRNWGPNHTRLKNIQLNLARAEIFLASETDIKTDINKANLLLDRAASRIATVLDIDAIPSTTEPWKSHDSGFLKAQLSLSELLEARGELEKALAIREEIVQAYRSRRFKDNRSLGSSFLGLSRLQIRLRRYEEARYSLNQAREHLSESLSTLNGDYTGHPLWVQTNAISDQLDTLK